MAKITFADAGDDFRNLGKLLALGSAGVVIADIVNGKRVKPIHVFGAAVTIFGFLL